MKVLICKNVRFLLDDEDYLFLIRSFTSFNIIYGYLVVCSKRRYLNVHRIIAEKMFGKIPKKKHVDHIDRDKTNNQRDNLRLVTYSQSAWNTNKRKCKTSSKFKGVTFVKRTKRFNAQISCYNKRHCLGSFPNEIDAAIAYDLKAKELFGEFAVLNFKTINRKDINRVLKYIGNAKKIHSINSKITTSKFLGVSKWKKYWIAQICYKYERFHLGYYKTEIEAAKAYNEAAIRLKGDKAKLNKFD